MMTLKKLKKFEEATQSGKNDSYDWINESSQTMTELMGQDQNIPKKVQELSDQHSKLKE